MAYFSFTRDILRGRPINLFEGPNHAPVARDFTYVDDVVKGCLAALSSKKKRGPGPPVRVYNLGNTCVVELKYSQKHERRAVKIANTIVLFAKKQNDKIVR
ncbi:UDP-glucuronate 4-epimerase 4 [Ananas comosus]|uniref:UDP-glucuronate 4-epimerase 4 n=1 Tax=Ananas comosus TaxID=4615 RepID=A0A199W405_ANACO|nr:UDP-glucuronate 4-epimerase 4 [Ananas comosus]